MQRSVQLDSITEDVQKHFGTLESNRLFLKPSPMQWSIAECLDHLIVTNESYFKTIEEIISGKFKMNFWHRHSPFTKMIIENMLRTLGPTTEHKFKSPKLFLPRSVKRMPKTIVNDFLEHQNRLKQYISKLEDGKYSGTIISSPVSGLVTLPLSGVIDILLIHEERHINQAKRIL